MTVSLDIVIVNWNSGGQLAQCIESIASAFPSEHKIDRIVVVDNASQDGSLEALPGCHLPIRIIRNSRNIGFAAACNQAIRTSKADFVLLLNPDTRVFAGTIQTCVEFLIAPEHEDIGIVGPQLFSQEGNLERSCARFPTAGTYAVKAFGLNRISGKFFKDHFMTEWDHTETRKVDQIIGAFFLFRRSLWESLDGFDERFFLYFEEVDFSLRARKAGWRSCYLAQAQAFHKGGGSSEKVKAKRLLYSLQSRILYGFKNLGFGRGLWILFLTVLIEPFSRIGFACIRFSLSEAVETCEAYGMLMVRLPQILNVAVHHSKNDLPQTSDDTGKGLSGQLN